MSENNANLSDEALYELVRHGNQLAYTSLYEKYWDELFKIAYHMTGSLHDAEDILHELFSELWLKRNQIMISKTFGVYVRTSLKYKVFRYFSQQGKSKLMVGEGELIEISSPDSTEVQLDFEELYDRIEVSVQNLPEKCREAFKLSRFEGKSVVEIAEIMKISPNTAQNHINKALKILRLDLHDYVSIATFFNALLIDYFHNITK
ncbi:RNA polymerase sigma factor [Aureibacter tunicatorum]|uniref:RNA polymerase sigma-70 factor (ECF subfamily) n=1 Tax=Aureibacter tunicatorum TaxID=866807 RepID=A0AAE3XQZ3_9BACT|nr:sigma-70 family RNA polymerase sigma factor [Aureibacter tunicatorum]MDR6240330.1 RNA polymerase sigma-70 factor (ECF subfamily) [Aureibacter tunicatorum]